jgi:HD-GYP domain-containing protein (c-di-GMP phosphodiesterase class II)
MERPLISPEHNDLIRELLRKMEEHAVGESHHAERVAVYSVATGERLGMSFEDLIYLRQASSLHDVGKIQVDRSLLAKLGDLTAEELRDLRLHAQESKRAVESLTWLAPCLPMIVHHHERWDGLGYPDGLAGEDIPLGARIIAVAEAYDVLANGVGWKKPIPEEEAAAEIKRCAGQQYDATVVKAFLEIRLLVQPIL